MHDLPVKVRCPVNMKKARKLTTARVELSNKGKGLKPGVVSRLMQSNLCRVKNLPS